MLEINKKIDFVQLCRKISCLKLYTIFENNPAPTDDTKRSRRGRQLLAYLQGHSNPHIQPNTRSIFFANLIIKSTANFVKNVW